MLNRGIRKMFSTSLEFSNYYRLHLEYAKDGYYVTCTFYLMKFHTESNLSSN